MAFTKICNIHFENSFLKVQRLELFEEGQKSDIFTATNEMIKNLETEFSKDPKSVFTALKNITLSTKSLNLLLRFVKAVIENGKLNDNFSLSFDDYINDLVIIKDEIKYSEYLNNNGKSKKLKICFDPKTSDP